MPQPGLTHASSTQRPLAATNHVTSTFCKGSWEIQVREYLVHTVVSAAHVTAEEPEGSR